MSEEVKNGRYEDKYGTVRWYQDGELHRLRGPAIVNADGFKMWWLNGECMTEEEHSKIILNKRLTEQLEVKPIGKKVKI